jgi:hypothetical protein
MLVRFGNMISALIGGPVYLVGSVLDFNNKSPRDWDLRLCLPDKAFALRYEPKSGLTDKGAAELVDRWATERSTGHYTPMYWRWADEMVRYSNMGREQTLLNIDFQVYPQSYFDKYKGQPSLRVDTRSALTKEK